MKQAEFQFSVSKKGREIYKSAGTRRTESSIRTTVPDYKLFLFHILLHPLSFKKMPSLMC
jgi:hypothetical protein